MFTSIRKRPAAAVAVFFLVLFLLGLFTAPDYGIYFDQQSEAVILRENLKEYAFSLLGEDSDAVRYYNSIGLPRITETPEIDHGMAAYYPLAPFMTLMDSDQSELFPLWNMLSWCWFMAGVLALYCLCRRLGMGRLAACAGAMLLYLSPRFFAEGHYNNKDMVLLSLALLVMLSGVRLWEKPTLLRGILFALAGALCANIKIIGVCIFGVMGLAALVLITARRSWNTPTAVAAVCSLLCFCLFYWLLTPAMWQDPTGYFAYLLENATGFTRWDNFVLFRGVMFQHSTSPLPFYYLPYMMLVTLPLYVVALTGLGQVTAIVCCWRQRRELLHSPVPMLLLCSTVIWAAPLGYAVLTGPVVYNGWRHFYFVFAGLSVLGAWGLECLIRFFGKHAKRWQQVTAAILAGLCLLTSAAGIAMNHPYQYAYYNALGRWLCPVPMEEGMELDYWCVATIDALEEAAEKLDRDEPIPYAARDNLTQLALYYYDEALPKSLQGRLELLEPGDGRAELIVVNPGYHHMYGTRIPEWFQVQTEIKSYGNTIIQVYARPEK